MVTTSLSAGDGVSPKATKNKQACHTQPQTQQKYVQQVIELKDIPPSLLLGTREGQNLGIIPKIELLSEFLLLPVDSVDKR